jgi:DNA-binding NtrC family response regulator
MKFRVLAIDDDLTVGAALRVALNNTRFELDTVSSGDEAYRLVRNSPLKYIAAFIDYNLGHGTDRSSERGDKVANALKKLNHDLECIILSGDQSPEAFSSWIRSGVDRYLYKPIESDKVLAILEAVAAQYESTLRLATATDGPCVDEESQALLRSVGLVGASKSSVSIAREIRKYAVRDDTVLILGETGTGKELVAKALHQYSKRSKAQFIAINCSTYRGDSDLLESELFGYERGAFTGAEKTTPGIFETVNGGVVFLDEIHHLSPSAQAKLLRVVQEKKVRRLGGKVELKVDFRIFAAAKANLRELSDAGDFLPDLYFRLNALNIKLLPLRERTDDIKPLLFHFKQKIEARDRSQKHLQQATVEILRSHSWPGNVRELEQLVTKLYAMVDEVTIRPNHIPEEITGSTRNRSTGSKTENAITTLPALSAQFERQQLELIMRALGEATGNITKAAESLGVPRTTMASLLKKYNLSASDSVPPRRSSWLKLGWSGDQKLNERN